MLPAGADSDALWSPSARVSRASRRAASIRSTLPVCAGRGGRIDFPRMIGIKYARGIELPGHGLWLDPWDKQPFAFVSHAHSDHTGYHEEIITSPATSRLMAERVPGRRIEHVLPFGEPTLVRGMRITLLPAGHVFGSAQFFLEEEDSLLYTGDFKLRQGLSAEAAQWTRADTLIMETTYGLPRYVFPPAEEIIAKMVAFCRETLEENAVPILLGYSLGKSQEILCALARAGMTPMLHGAVHRITEIYRKLQPDFPPFLRYNAQDVSGKVLICPPSANRSIMVRRIKARRTAVLSGWALDPGAAFRYQCDAAFPLSDHADYPDLIRYVELVQPRRVLTLHGFAAAFARDLRERGIEAWALSENDQLELRLPGSRRRTPASVGAPAAEEPASASEFHRFASVCETVAATTAKLKKTETLRDYFRLLPPGDLEIAAVYLTGRAFPQADGASLQTGWAVIKRAVLAVSGIGEEAFREIANRYADAGKTARDALQGKTKPTDFSMKDSRAFFVALRQRRGPLAKTALLEEWLERLTPLEGSCLVRILTGDLRIGLKEGLVEEGIAAAFERDVDEVKGANMVLGDIGKVAALAAAGALDTAALRLFSPIKVMLASPEASAVTLWERMKKDADLPPPLWVEDKFDGIRAQLHRSPGRVEIFSRDLRRITEQFPEIADAARNLRADVILDGEIVAFEHGRKLTFFDLQKRLGRRDADLFMESEIPVRFMAFDLLWKDGRPLLNEPLKARRALLEELELPPLFEAVRLFRAQSVDDIEAVFTAARGRSNEGLMVKDAESLYTPGRRGLAWLKLKKELATLDVVVVGAELGHGKRSGVLSDYTFAVRDDTSGELLTIGKAYSGLTDVEIEDLTRHFKSTTVAQRGRYREVRPEVVLEVAFNSVQPSERHASGLALRFPRIKAIRTDKTPENIDTLKYARSLVE